MKPLALEWFRKHEMLDAYYLGGSYVPYAIVGRDKRFSDAELAAEVWAPNWLTLPGADWDGNYAGTVNEMKRRMAITHRFATHPYHDTQ